MPTAIFLVGIKSKLEVVMLYMSDRLATGMEVKCQIKHYYGDDTSYNDFALWNFGIQGNPFGGSHLDIWDPR